MYVRLTAAPTSNPCFALFERPSRMYVRLTVEAQPDAPDDYFGPKRLKRSNWHTKKAWAKANPEKAAAQRARHRRKKPAMYLLQMKKYMRKVRAERKRLDQIERTGVDNQAPPM